MTQLILCVLLTKLNLPSSAVDTKLRVWQAAQEDHKGGEACEFAGASITPWVGKNMGNLLSHGSGGQTSKIKVLAGPHSIRRL